MMGKKQITNTRTVLQIEDTECGAACLCMILQHYGQYVSLERLRMETDVSRDGCSAGNIARAAQRRGLQCDGYQKQARQLEELTPPCILWWEYNHFVVFEGIRDGFCYINDPAVGKRRLDMQRLEKSFSGVVLVFSPEPAFADFPEYGQRPPKLLRAERCRAFFRSYRVRAVCAIATGWVAAAAGIAAAALSGMLRSGSHITPLLLSGIFLFCYFAGTILSETQLKRLADSHELQASWQYLQGLFQMPIAFLEQRSPVNLMERVRKNDRLSRFMAWTMLRGIIHAGTILLVLIYLLRRSPLAALLIILTLALALGAQIYLERTALRERARAQVCETAFAETLFAGARMLDTIRTLDLGARYANEAVAQQQEVISAHQNMASIGRRQMLLRSILYALCVTVIIATQQSAGQGIEGIAGIEIYFWLLLFLILFPAAEGLLRTLAQLRQADEDLGFAEDMIRQDVQATEAPIKPQPAAASFQKLQGNIRCSRVSFAYGAFGSTIVDGLNLYLPTGSFLAVTGKTGSGKSTIGKLLGGLLEPTEGRILYDGTPAAEIPQQVISASIAMVEQKPKLFAGTIRNNITMWNPNIPEEDIRQAVKDACVEDCINSRPDGLETHLGERGRGLSGGEAQRLEIARALAVNPSILILDEAFSAIDDLLKERILANIRRRGCTCIIMTHDPLLIDHCGQILGTGKRGGACPCS